MADYTLYLVTDSTPAILGDKDICDVVDRAIRGGVTIVQYRDKTSDTGDLVATARRLHAVTQRHGVPLLINDRVDVALAVGCEGVHLGQDDMGESAPWRSEFFFLCFAEIKEPVQISRPPGSYWEMARSSASRPTQPRRPSRRASRARITWA